MSRLALASLLVAAATAPAADPVRYAVLVGVNRYDHRNLPPLAFAVNDTAELGDVLRGLGYKVTLLTDATAQKPTRANIDAALKQVLRGAGRGDTVVIGLSGHGLQFGTDKATGAYFCPADAVPSDRRTETLVPLGDLYRELEDTNAGVKVLLVDACRNDPKAAATGRTRSGVGPAAAPPHGVAALFSCSRGQESLEHDALKHGVFFHHVIEGLKGKARSGDGEVTFNTLADFVTRRVGRTAATLRDGFVQTPSQRADLEGESPVLAARPAEAVAAKPTGDEAAAPPAAVAAAVGGAGGKAKAWVDLGRDQYFGQNSRTNSATEAMKWFRKAADAGDPAGMAWVGFFYSWGKGGLTKDEGEALGWFRRAADAGDAFSLYRVGNFYQYGQGGLTADMAEAVRWFLRAADAGERSAMNSLGVCYRRGLGGLAKDDAEAARWYRKAADAGNPVAMHNLGWMCDTGYAGQAKDEAEAARWYRKAADAGNPLGMIVYGMMCETGRGGLDKDPAVAIGWYRKAADLGHQFGMANLGRCYQHGLGGLTADKQQAIEWFKKAGTAGWEPAKAKLKQLGVADD